SCSAKNNISLNINLARLPDELRDYVILHELVHTRIKNHSKKFWAELDKVIGGGAKELSKKLRKYRLGTTASKTSPGTAVNDT
ncbi:MAG: M48 metallopeptidase family protein, partial [Planctomycetota bacterium]